ncbi:MAG: hypothetical protein ACP5UU_06370, partial [Thermoprotei archaeon]
MPIKSSNRWDTSADMGNKPSPKRHWHCYDEGFVIRGEFLLSIRSFKHWKKYLKKADKNKRGRPYL